MSEPSKLHSNPRRHGQLVSSSSHSLQSHSRKELITKASFSFEKRPGSKAQTTGVSHGETEDVGGTDKKTLIPLELVKTPISRQRISVTITPRASARVGHKTKAEKENVKIDDTPLRQTIARFATSCTSRRTAVPLGNSGSVKAKNTYGSKEAHNDRSPLSATLPLSSRKSSSALEQKRVVTKNRTVLSVRSPAQSITALPNEFDQPIKTSASMVTGAHIRTLPLEDVRPPPTNLENVDAPKTCFSLDAAPSVGIKPDTPGAARVSRSPSALALASASPAMAPDGIGPSNICGAPLTPELSSTFAEQLIANDSNTRTKGTMMSHPEGHPTKFSEGDEYGNRASGQSIELTEIPTTVDHTCNSRAVGEGSDSRTSSTANIATATLIGNKRAAAPSRLESQSITKSKSFSKLKHMQGTKFGEFTMDQSLGFEKDTATDVLRSQTSSREDISAVASPDPSIPTTPPPTPALSLSPSPSASTSPITSLPSSIFPHLFTELTTTYTHLGFGAKTVLSSSTRRANENAQAERTQRELERLRAGGSGLVLARARVFGQTLRTSNSVLSVRERSTVEPVVETSALKVLGSDTPREMNEVLVQEKGVSECISGPVRVSPPPPPSVSSAIDTPTLRRNEPPPKARTQSRRILGCADLTCAVAMAEALWKTKNFVLE